jgi:uncharacterized protein
MQNRLMPAKTISFGLLFLVFKFAGFAQTIDISADLLLIESVTKQQIHHSEKRIYIFKNQPKTLKNCNPISLVYGGSLYVYQNFISQHFSADCLYDPSCSDFSKNAVKEYGLIKGGLLTIDRLGRCNRIAATELNLSLMNLKTHRFSDSINRYR